MQLEVDVAFTWKEVADRKSFSPQVAVVIDVLRATSTMVAALAHGAQAIVPTTTVEEAWALRSRYLNSGFRHPLLLGGERGGVKIEGFDLGNSPGEYTPERVAEKTIIFSTTNGTQALAAARSLPEPKVILAAALLNARAASDYISQLAQNQSGSPAREAFKLLLICSGTEGRVSAEDTVAAGSIVHRLHLSFPLLTLTDAAMVAEAFYLTYRSRLPDLLLGTKHGQKLAALGFQDDLSFCAREDEFVLVPIWAGDRLRAATPAV